jgi:hypothetical protein
MSRGGPSYRSLGAPESGHYMRSEVVGGVNINITVLWDVRPYNPV